MIVYIPETDSFHFVNFTEGEVANYLHIRGINNITSKQERLATARKWLTPIIEDLWNFSRTTKDFRESRYTATLAAKLDSFQGLNAVVKLASYETGAVRNV